MVDFNEIPLSSLKGIDFTIGEKCDSDGNGKLTGAEISIFSAERNSNRYIFEKNLNIDWFKKDEKEYNIYEDIDSTIDMSQINKKRIGNYTILTQQTRLNSKTIIYDNAESNDNDAKVKTFSVIDYNGNIIVTYEREQIVKNKMNGKFQLLNQKTSFSYNIKDLEDYIIFKAESEGKNITYFKEIPEIRSLPKKQRTKEQAELLEEFNKLIKYVTEIGTDYGVDPKYILAIIQEEVKFDGLGKKSNVTGTSGKGYMQLTTSVPADILNCTGYEKDPKTKKVLMNVPEAAIFANGDKINQYGVEIIELFESRGFHIQNAKTAEQKKVLLAKICDYLKDNDDPEFNIRLGTLKLRRELNRAKGDFSVAAFNYNGNPGVQEGYKIRTTESYNILSKNLTNKTKYSYVIEKFGVPSQKEHNKK